MSRVGLVHFEVLPILVATEEGVRVALCGVGVAPGDIHVFAKVKLDEARHGRAYPLEQFTQLLDLQWAFQPQMRAVADGVHLRVQRCMVSLFLRIGRAELHGVGLMHSATDDTVPRVKVLPLPLSLPL